MQENQWPRNPVLTFWQSKRICSDNAISRRERPLWVINGHLERQSGMSALPPKADIVGGEFDVR